MSGIKIYNVGLNGIQLSKGMTVPEFKSWVVSTLGGSGDNYYQSVIKSSDGGYIAVGYQNSDSQGNYDALIVKYDSNLNLITQKGLGGSASDRYYSICQSHDGGYIAVGYQFSDSQGNYDALIVKYDSNLDVISQHGLGGLGYDSFQSVIQSNDGGYIAVGYQNSDSQGNYDALIVKYDSNLNLITQKGLGGLGYDRYYSICQSHDGGYIAVGYQNSEGQGSSDALIVKYDSNLDLVNQYRLGSTGNDALLSIIKTSDNGYVAVGYEQSGNQVDNTLIVKSPNDFSLLSGSLINHGDLEWSEINLTETTPTLTETTPTLTETTPTLVESSLTLTVTAPSLTSKRSEKQ